MDGESTPFIIKYNNRESNKKYLCPLVVFSRLLYYVNRGRGSKCELLPCTPISLWIYIPPREKATDTFPFSRSPPPSTVNFTKFLPSGPSSPSIPAVFRRRGLEEGSGHLPLVVFSQVCPVSLAVLCPRVRPVMSSMVAAGVVVLEGGGGWRWWLRASLLPNRSSGGVIFLAQGF